MISARGQKLEFAKQERGTKICSENGEAILAENMKPDLGGRDIVVWPDLRQAFHIQAPCILLSQVVLYMLRVCGTSSQITVVPPSHST